MDVVYILGTGSKWLDNEIRLSLRSVEKNFVNLGKVFVIGTQEVSWLNNVEFIQCNDINKHNKEANIIRKTLVACQNGVSEEFVRFSDDQLILKNWNPLETFTYYSDDIKNSVDLDLSWEEYEKVHNNWKRRLRRTYEYLKEQNLSTFNYETHIPVRYNKHLFQDIINKSIGWDEDRGGYGYTINTLYFNQILKTHHKIPEIKAQYEQKIEDIEVLKSIAQNKLFMGYNNAGLTSALKDYLTQLFPYSSVFEKTLKS